MTITQRDPAAYARTIGESAVGAPAVPEPETTLTRYLATLEPPLRRGKVKAALERFHRFNGVAMPRHAMAERLATQPGVHFNLGHSRLYTSEDVFFDAADLTRAMCDYVAYLLEQKS